MIRRILPTASKMQPLAWTMIIRQRATGATEKLEAMLLIGCRHKECKANTIEPIYGRYPPQVWPGSQEEARKAGGFAGGVRRPLRVAPDVHGRDRTRRTERLAGEPGKNRPSVQGQPIRTVSLGVTARTTANTKLALTITKFTKPMRPSTATRTSGTLPGRANASFEPNSKRYLGAPLFEVPTLPSGIESPKSPESP